MNIDLTVSDKAARRASRKAARRLIPFLTLCYVIAFLDRVNVGFAALIMNKELGLTAEMFGFGAGIFFFGYFIFEVPSNLILDRVGARRWIARIMISWGVISGSFAFVPSISAIFQNLGFLYFDNAHLLPHAVHIRCGGGGVLSRRHSLSHLLVHR
jgi:sugar phosphate permease